MKASHTLYILILTMLFLIGACSDSVDQRLAKAEELVFTSPDSAMTVLHKMGILDNEEQEALRCMLYVWAEYRNYEKVIPEGELNKAFSFFQNSKNQLRKAQVHYLRSVINEDQKRGNEKQKTEDLFIAAKAIEKTDSHLLAAKIYQRIASIMNDRHDIEEGIAWSMRYLDAAKKANDVTEEIVAMVNLSQGQMFKGDKNKNYDEAISTLQQALKIANDNNLDGCRARVYRTLTSLYGRDNKPDSALYYAIKAKDIQEELLAKGLTHEEPRYWTIGDAYRKLGNADSALYYARKAYNSTDIRARINASQITYIVYYEILHDYKKSAEWMAIHRRQGDTLRQIQQKEDVAIACEKVAKQEVEEKLSYTRSLLWEIIGACILIIILVITCMFVMRRRMKNKLHLLQDELNEHIQLTQNNKNTAISTDSECVDTGNSIINFVGHTKESLSLLLDNFIFAESEGNYLNINYIEDGETKQKMLRMTMKQAEEASSEYWEIQRCHRAYIVNIKHILHVSAVPNGLRLKLDASTIQVPVSKTYVDSIRAAIAK